MASRILAKASALAIFVTLFGGPQADAKTLRVNLNADPSQIDPITYSELNSYQVLEQVYEGFTSMACLYCFDQLNALPQFKSRSASPCLSACALP